MEQNSAAAMPVMDSGKKMMEKGGKLPQLLLLLRRFAVLDLVSMA